MEASQRRAGKHAIVTSTGRGIDRLESRAREKSTWLAAAEAEFVRAARLIRGGELEDVVALAALVLGHEGSLLNGATKTV